MSTEALDALLGEPFGEDYEDACRFRRLLPAAREEVARLREEGAEARQALGCILSGLGIGSGQPEVPITAASAEEWMRRWRERAEKAEAELAEARAAHAAYVADTQAAREEAAQAWAVLTGQDWTQTRTEGACVVEASRVVAERDSLRSGTYCAYCGERFLLDDLAATSVDRHVRSCAKHPMREVEAERDALRKRLKEIRAMLAAVEAPPAPPETGRGT